MAAPTFVAQYSTADWSTYSATPKAVMTAVAINSGDVLIGIAAEASTTDSTLAWTENGTASWVDQKSDYTAAYCGVLGSSYTCTGNETLTVTLNMNGSQIDGGTVVRFSGSTGVGASAAAKYASTSQPSISLTTTADNSAIVVICADWNASQVPNTDQVFTNNFSGSPQALSGFLPNGNDYGVACCYFPDAGAQGSKTIGMSGPTGQKWNMIAIEVKGTAGGGGAPIAALSSDNCNNVWQR